MHYECEGCGRILREEHCLQYAHFEFTDENKSTLIFCPPHFFGRKRYIWCLENTLYAMCQSVDEAKSGEKMLIRLEMEIHEPFGGRQIVKSGRFKSLSDLKKAMKSRVNKEYERSDLNIINGQRLAEGDYLTPSLWLNEKANGRAIKKIEIEKD
ncbi:hypothetical protein GF312_01650 [Candidatus Poribacteria bacterium]|nr:hypothetical protein [Candidatus Poribacteria bacterium]